jgi:hypothetical protein
MKPVVRLLATAANVDGITEMVNRFWYSDSYRVNPDSLVIEHPSRTVTGYRVRLLRGRLRFESVD